MNRKILICQIIALLILLTAASWSGDNKICDYCKKAIDGQFYNINGRYFHINHFLCTYCKKPITETNYYSENGYYYHTTCYKNAIMPKCAYCGKPIEGIYTESGGKLYHKECFDSNLALRCAICDGIINGNYLRDTWGNNYHTEHENSVPRCLYCGRFFSPASEGGQRYLDNRTVCGLCIKTAVNDPDDAEEIFSEIAEKLTAYGIEVNVGEIKFSLIDCRRMAEINKTYTDGALGFTEYEQTDYVFGLIKDRHLRISMLNGMPRMQFVAAAAHELMHAWMFSDGPDDMDRKLSEGSCSYVAYLILKDDQSPEAQYVLHNMLTETDPIYGDGLRRVKAWVESNDIPAWLNYIKENNQPPW
jgi:hypothetical protein